MFIPKSAVLISEKGQKIAKELLRDEISLACRGKPTIMGAMLVQVCQKRVGQLAPVTPRVEVVLDVVAVVIRPPIVITSKAVIRARVHSTTLSILCDKNMLAPAKHRQHHLLQTKINKNRLASFFFVFFGSVHENATGLS